MSARDVLDEQVTGGAPSLPAKLTLQMAAMSRHRPFSRGSSMGAFDLTHERWTPYQAIASPRTVAGPRS